MKNLLALALINFVALSSSCQHNKDKNQETPMKDHSHTNALINETSPYLLQHAHNPVNWYPWGDEALKKAKEENKLILVSIGYSACHWCHVMERESFEDETVAAYMNEHFVCIKVDREERPDVDQIYMEAVQLITGSGGWPLNCFALPDGRPFYGGTYFPKKNWLYLLNNVVEQYNQDRDKFEEYANNLTSNINRIEFKSLNTSALDYKGILERSIADWKTRFDEKEGGPNRSPKFPIPNNYEFLLDYALLSNDESSLDHVELTLDKMAAGGIYDQIGGGFARYSTDEIWKVPHFEKMLYDNAQLISLYSKAYQHFKDEEYKRVVQQSLDFIEREMTEKKGAFYSALDADSEGEEGKFYIWTEDELKEILGQDYEFVSALYSIEKKYVWEHGNYILHRQQKARSLMSEFNMDETNYWNKVDDVNARLIEKRSERIRPGLDDKTLTSWNAMMISAYCDAYTALGIEDYRKKAIRSAAFIWDQQYSEESGLLHNYKNGQSNIPGFHEDYAFLMEAMINLYSVTFDETYLDRAEILKKECIKYFFDAEQQMFYFTSAKTKDLVARKMEITDNVIPASNSVMAKNLFKLGTLRYNEDDLKIADNMLKQVGNRFEQYPSGFSNWMSLALNEVYPHLEIAIVGNDFESLRLEFGQTYIPNAIFLGGKKEGSLPLLEHKLVKGENTIYVCQNKTCKLPVNDVSSATQQIKEIR